MNTTRLTALELTITEADVIESHSDGVDVITRDGVTLHLDGRLVDRIVTEHATQKRRETNLAAIGWQPSVIAGGVA